MGVTEMGLGLNTGVQPPEDLPQELAPHSQVAPFEWVSGGALTQLALLAKPPQPGRELAYLHGTAHAPFEWEK